MIVATFISLWFKPTFDSDPLWGVEIGKYILQHGIPYTDPFSWTVYGKSWITHEWLFCVLIYKLYSLFGDYGFLIYITTGMIFLGAAIYLWNKAYESHFGYLVSAGTLFIVYAYGFAQSRAFLWAFGLTMVIAYLLRFNKKIYLVPILIMVWANWHGSVILGLFIIFVEAIYRYISSRKLDYAGIFIVSCLAGIINPYGWKIYELAAFTLSAPETKFIIEWQSPDLSIPVLLVVYVGFAFFAFMVMYKYPLQKQQVMNIFWFWFFFVLALSSIRYLSYALLFFIPYILGVAKDAVQTKYNKPFVVAACVLILSVGFITHYHDLSFKNTWEPYQDWPNEAVSFLKENPEYQDRLYNEYVFGALLMKEGVKPFIDARCDVYMENGVMNDYIILSTLKESPKKILDKYNMQNLFLLKGSQLDIYLEDRPDWKEVFSDDKTVIYRSERN